VTESSRYSEQNHSAAIRSAEQENRTRAQSQRTAPTQTQEEEQQGAATASSTVKAQPQRIPPGHSNNEQRSGAVTRVARTRSHREPYSDMSALSRAIAPLTFRTSDLHLTAERKSSRGRESAGRRWTDCRIVRRLAIRDRSRRGLHGCHIRFALCVD
jgi:hypothetical protein